MTGVKVIESSKIYSGGSINLRKDNFSLNGKLVDKEIVEHQDSVGIVAVRGRQRYSRYPVPACGKQDAARDSGRKDRKG